MVSEKEIIDGCKAYNRAAQKLLYNKFAPRMYAVCLRYLKNPETAKDLLQDGFIKVFSNIGKYSYKGSLEGWIRRVIVNEIITYLNKEKKFKWESISSVEYYEEMDSTQATQKKEEIAEFSFEVEVDEFTAKELEDALENLHETYKIVFKLYHIEEFSHSEIGKMLHIDEATSRSRLFRAKKILKEYLSKVRNSKSIRVQSFR